MNAIDNCPYCSYSLLPQLRPKSRYWYCLRCRLEVFDCELTAGTKTALHQIKSQRTASLH